MDWAEIVELCDLDIHPDTLRKAGMGVKLVSEAGMITGATETDAVVDEIAVQDHEPTFSELQKMRDLRREINEHYRADARSELLRESVKEAAKLLPPVAITAPVLETSNNRRLVVGIADMHYGAEWRVCGLKDEVINEYNPEIFERRMEKLLAEVIRILHKEDIQHVDLLMAGDSLDGMLRQSQLMKLRWGAVESCMRFAEYMVQWLCALSEHANVRVFNVDGNHTETRPLGSKKGEFANENLEKIVTWHLAARLTGNERVEVCEPCKKMKLFDVCGYSFLLLHGDMEKRLDSMAKQAVLQYGAPIDFFICGHKHKEQEMVSGLTDDGHSVIVRLSSVCGVDGFALSLGYNGRPGATAMVIEAEYGRRCTYPIQL